jgi:hypothetical protein
MFVVMKNIIKASTIISLSIYTLTGFAEVTNTSSTIPSKGMTQAQVKSAFGEPSLTKPPVGKPPISRWDYSNYSVYFEGKYVIHSFRNSQRIQPVAINPKPATAPPPQTTQPKQSKSEIAPPKMHDEPIVEEIEANIGSIKPDVNENAEVNSEVNAEDLDKAIKQAKTERDLNFEEPEKGTDFSKWDY